jgi:hypothetical protein
MFVSGTPAALAAIAAVMAANPGRVAAEAAAAREFKEVLRDLFDAGHGELLRQLADSPALAGDERELVRQVLFGGATRQTPRLLH